MLRSLRFSVDASVVSGFCSDSGQELVVYLRGSEVSSVCIRGVRMKSPGKLLLIDAFITSECYGRSQGDILKRMHDASFPLSKVLVETLAVITSPHIPFGQISKSLRKD